MNRRALVAYSYMIGGLSFFITGFLILLNYTLNSDLKYVDNSAKLATFRRANFTELLIVASSASTSNTAASNVGPEVYFYSLCQVNFELESSGTSSSASIKDDVLNKNALLRLRKRRQNTLDKKGSFRISKISNTGQSGFGSSKLQQIRVVKSLLVRKLLHLAICSSEKLFLALVSLLSVCGSIILLVGCVKFYEYDSEQSGLSGSATSLLQKFTLLYRVLVFFRLVKKRPSSRNPSPTSEQPLKSLDPGGGTAESEYTDINLARRSLAAERMCPFVYEELPAFMMNNSSFFLTKDETKNANDRPDEIVNMPPLPPLVIANTNSLIASFELNNESNKKPKKSKNQSGSHKQSSLSPKLPSSQPPALKNLANNNSTAATLPVRKSNEDTIKYNTLTVSGSHTVRFKAISDDSSGSTPTTTSAHATITTAQVGHKFNTLSTSTSRKTNPEADRSAAGHKQQHLKEMTISTNAFSNNNYETFDELETKRSDESHSVIISSRPPAGMPGTGRNPARRSNQAATGGRLSTGIRRSRHQSMLCDLTINDTSVPLQTSTNTTTSNTQSVFVSSLPQDPTMPKILASRVVNVNTESIVNTSQNPNVSGGIASSSSNVKPGSKKSNHTNSSSSNQTPSSNDGDNQVVKHFL